MGEDKCTPSSEEKARVLESDAPESFKRQMMDDLISDPKTDNSTREQALNYKKDNYFNDYIYTCHTSSNENSCLMTDRARIEATRSVNLTEMGIFPAGAEINSFEKLVANIIKFLARVIGVCGVLAIMYGGVMLTVSSGSESVQSRAKEIIFGGIIATVAVLGAYVVISTVLQISFSLGK